MRKTLLAMLITALATVTLAGEVRIDQRRLQARKNLSSDQPGTSGRAVRTLIQKLAATGYTPVPTSAQELIGALPSIINHVQGLLDAKDAQLAARLQMIQDHADANQFRQAFADQIEWDQLMRQRCQIQDGYNEIQSWALAFILRKGAGQ